VKGAGLSVLQQNQSCRFGCVAFANDFCCNVNVLSGGKANECRICNLDKSVVHAISMDMGDATFLHV